MNTGVCFFEIKKVELSDKVILRQKSEIMRIKRAQHNTHHVAGAEKSFVLCHLEVS